jgi:ATP synthase protein I
LSHKHDDDLAQRIAKAQAEANPREIKREESRGYAIGMEFIGAVLAGGLIGWFLDRWLGTAPWLMIVMLGLGFAAGTRNVIKRTSQFDGSPDDKDGIR